ncbi:MAG TPA: LytTR family DNA-binding domain-containing protein [Longimicrobiaceae bacterium]
MPDGRPLRVVIADDEPLGVGRLAELLSEQPDVEVVATAENGEEAIRAIRELRPDLVFLDIRMPRKSGLEVVREVGPDRMPATVFVTAYDRHAVEAFDLAAVDYLVKPYDDERFEEAFRRARRKIELEGLDGLREQMLRLLQSGQGDPPAPFGKAAQERYLRRIAVPMRGRMRVIPVEEIDYITASGVYAELHSAGGRHLIRAPLQALEEQLDPAEFMRIHRSVIVRLDRVQMLLRGGQGKYEVQLRDGIRLPVGRSRRTEVEQRLGRR